MKKRILAMVLSLAMIFALAACGGGSGSGGSNSTPAPAGTGTPGTTAPENSGNPSGGVNIEKLDVAMTTSMGDVGPFAFSSAGRNNLRFFCYEYLAQFKEFGQTWQEMELQLAKEIRQIDDVTYQVEIYDYIVDAIGNPVKASDVAFCFNQLAESGVTTRITKALESAVAIDDTTVEIKVTSTEVGVFEYLLYLVQIVSEKTYTENEARMNTTPITTAPYQITECVDGSYYIITKNENYWQKPELCNWYAQQPIESMQYHIITEGSQATMALQTGEVDLITSVRNAELSYFLNPDGTPVEGFSVTSTPSTTPVSLLFNMAEGSDGDLFRDNLELRQAVCYAINQADIVAIAYSGYAEPAFDLACSGCGDYNPDWNNEDYYNYDLDKAKELLAAAGYADGKKDGQPVTIRLISASTYSAAAQVLQTQLMALGFTVDYQALDDAMFAASLQDSTAWDIAIHKKGTEGYISAVYDGLLLRNKNGVGANNFIVDDKLEELLQTAHNIQTHNEESIDELHYYVKDNAIAYGLFNVYEYTVARAGMQPAQFPLGSWSIPNCAVFTN